MEKESVNYRRNLPHIQPYDGCFFVTYRLYGSVPNYIRENYISELEELKVKPFFRNKASNLFLETYDQYLDNCSNIHCLRNEKLAKVVMDSLHFYDNKYFELVCYSIMSNHVHVIVDCKGYENINLSRLFGRIKGFSSNKCNKIRNTVGSKFWAQEIYDHLIIDENELNFYIKYVINNPVSANLVSDWRDFAFIYLKDKYVDDSIVW